MKSIEFFNKNSQSLLPRVLTHSWSAQWWLMRDFYFYAPISLFHCAYMAGLWGWSFSDHLTKYYRHLSQVGPVSSVAREQENTQCVNPISLARKTVMMRSNSYPLPSIRKHVLFVQHFWALNEVILPYFLFVPDLAVMFLMYSTHCYLQV